MKLLQSSSSTYFDGSTAVRYGGVLKGSARMVKDSISRHGKFGGYPRSSGYLTPMGYEHFTCQYSFRLNRVEELQK